MERNSTLDDNSGPALSLFFFCWLFWFFYIYFIHMLDGGNEWRLSPHFRATLIGAPWLHSLQSLTSARNGGQQSKALGFQRLFLSYFSSLSLSLSLSLSFFFFNYLFSTSISTCSYFLRGSLWLLWFVDLSPVALDIRHGRSEKKRKRENIEAFIFLSSYTTSTSSSSSSSSPSFLILLDRVSIGGIRGRFLR